ncbi:MAG: hypothetical protein WCY29_11330 [Novosphingobium sp.]
MRALLTPIALMPLVLSLAACGPADNDPGPGGVTVGEARALDEAAEMIEQRRPPANVLPSPSEPRMMPSGSKSP